MHYLSVTARSPHPANSLDELLRRFLADADEAAMQELVRQTRPRLLGAAARIGDPQDAEDTVQAAYHALLRRASTPAEGPVVAWLLTATIRIAYRRKAGRRRDECMLRLLAPTNPEPDAAAQAISAEAAAQIRRAVTRLPAKYRDVLVLHHLQGIAVAQLAELLGVPESTVKSRLQRGRGLLRSRLPISLHACLTAIPWAAKDAWTRLAIPARCVVGGAMKTKSVALAASLVIFALLGIVGYATVVRTESAGDADGRTVAPPDIARGPVRPNPRAVVPHRRSPPAAEDPASAEPTPSEPARRPATPDPTRAAPDSSSIPDEVRRAAAALDVPEAALRLAWDAYVAGRENTSRGIYDVVPQEALDQLRAQGPFGFNAVLALFRGGVNGTWMRDLVGATWSAGLERDLLAVCDDAAVPAFSRWSALQSLACADTGITRDALVERLPRLAHERDGGLFWCASGALAELHESRAAESVAAQLGRMEWGDVIRTGLMAHLVDMDRDVARRALREWLLRSDADLLAEATTSLARVDAAAARDEAARLLDGPRAGSLDASTIWKLRELAGRPQPATPR